MIVDIILILALALSVFVGYKKGFVKVAVKFATFILAIVLSFLLQSSVAKFIGEEIGLKNTISITVQSKLTGLTENEEEELKTDINMLEKTVDEINNAAEDKKAEIIKMWSDNIANFVLKGISFIVIFLTVSILMGIIGLILNSVVKLPVLKTLNGFLGGITEFVLMLFRVMIILTIIYFVSPLEIAEPIIKYINSSCITKLLYENNIIISILGRKLM